MRSCKAFISLRRTNEVSNVLGAGSGGLAFSSASPCDVPEHGSHGGGDDAAGDDETSTIPMRLSGENGSLPVIGSVRLGMRNRLMGWRGG